MDWNREQCIAALNDLVEEYPDKPITRDFFRKNSDCPEYQYLRYFGSFGEFKIQAGHDFTSGQTKLLSAITKHASKDKLRELNVEKREYEGRYLRPDTKRFQTIVTITDTHDIAFDPFTKRVYLESLKRIKPEVIVFGGDHFDLPEFSKYFNDPRNYNIIERINSVHDFLKQIREIVPDAEFNWIGSNHESVEENTEILTDNGWKICKDLELNDVIASYKIDTGEITYDNPVAIAKEDNKSLVHVSGYAKDELLKYNHNIDYEGKLVSVENFIGQDLKQNKFRYSGIGDQTGIELTDDEIRLITWVVMDGCFVKHKTKQNEFERIQFKISKKRKIDGLKSILEKMQVKYTLKEATKSGVNKLQPYYIRIYGDDARKIISMFNGKKELPNNFSKMDSEQLKIFLDELAITDGCKRDNGIDWPTTSKHDVDIIQLACIHNNIDCYYSIKENCSGFGEGKIQYHVRINKLPIRTATVTTAGTGNIVSVQSKNGTLITRRNGKVAFTGNCRLFRHLSESSPNIMVLLNDLHGFTISKLLGLDKYEINYISREDLTVFTEADLKKEIGKNYLVKFDSVLFHHYPEGKKYGLPGCNGHHHSRKTETLHNLTYGTYEWNQLGAGHIRKASFCDAQKWSNGFMITHVDTHTHRVQFEYIDTTQDFAVMGGKWYTRNEDELINL